MPSNKCSNALIENELKLSMISDVRKAVWEEVKQLLDEHLQSSTPNIINVEKNNLPEDFD